MENEQNTKAAIRKGQPVTTGVLNYFPNAIKAVAECSLAGNKQHNLGNALNWDMSKSTDEPDAMVRHLMDHFIEPVDDDGIPHVVKVAWRALALCERYLQAENGAKSMFSNTKQHGCPFDEPTYNPEKIK